MLVTRPVPEGGLGRLRAACRTLEVLPESAAGDRAVLLSAIRGRDAIITELNVRVDRAFLAAAAPTCRVLANFGVGVDHIDLAGAAEHGIVVTNTPDVLTDATADLTWALMFAVARRVCEGHALVCSGAWSGWAPLQMLGADVSGRRLGIVGAGRIGTAVGKRAIGFDMSLSYVSPRASPTLDRLGAVRVELNECLSDSDFVTLHVPLTATTRHMIGAEQLRRMRSTAFLINTSRGPAVDEQALVEALRDGLIAGAGLDVYEFEPHPLPALLALPNVVGLPHVGSATIQTRTRMAEMAAENALAVLESRPPPNPVSTAGHKP